MYPPRGSPLMPTSSHLSVSEEERGSGCVEAPPELSLCPSGDRGSQISLIPSLTLSREDPFLQIIPWDLEEGQSEE